MVRNFEPGPRTCPWFGSETLWHHRTVEQYVHADRLAALGKPLLVIYGEDDRRWRSLHAADYHAVAGAHVEILPGLGHSPHLEDPPRTAAPLLAFTATLGRQIDRGDRKPASRHSRRP